MLQSLATNYNYIAANSVRNEITSCILGKQCVIYEHTHTHTHTQAIYTYVQDALQTKGADMTQLVTVYCTQYFTHVFKQRSFTR